VFFAVKEHCKRLFFKDSIFRYNSLSKMVKGACPVRDLLRRHFIEQFMAGGMEAMNTILKIYGNASGAFCLEGGEHDLLS
jgi:hypothetical protein